MNLNPHLPCKSAAVYIRGIKQTADVANNIKFALGLVEAEHFYTSTRREHRPDGSRRKGGLGCSHASFFAVDWWTLDTTLAEKSQMYSG